MWKDLSDRTAELKESPFVAHLIDTPRDPYAGSSEFMKPAEIDEKIDPSELFMPLPADSSQFVALNSQAQGGAFLLEAQPGTAQSPTMAHFICTYLSLGGAVGRGEEVWVAGVVREHFIEKMT